MCVHFNYSKPLNFRGGPRLPTNFWLTFYRQVRSLLTFCLLVQKSLLYKVHHAGISFFNHGRTCSCVNIQLCLDINRRRPSSFQISMNRTAFGILLMITTLLPGLQWVKRPVRFCSKAVWSQCKYLQ